MSGSFLFSFLPHRSARDLQATAPEKQEIPHLVDAGILSGAKVKNATYIFWPAKVKSVFQPMFIGV